MAKNKSKRAKNKSKMLEKKCSDMTSSKFQTQLCFIDMSRLSQPVSSAALLVGYCWTGKQKHKHMK